MVKGLIIAIFFLGVQPLYAQGEKPVEQEKGKSSFTTVFEGPPGKAALFSLVIPGAGQIYNSRWWKAPIVWAVEGTVGYILIDRINTYNKWNNCYISLIESTAAPECGSVNDISTAFSLRQNARSNRELAWVFMGVTHLLNVVEAFVDRHLMNFDTSDDLSLNTIPHFDDFHESPWPVVDFISIRIPLNGRSSQ